MDFPGERSSGCLAVESVIDGVWNLLTVVLLFRCSLFSLFLQVHQIWALRHPHQLLPLHHLLQRPHSNWTDPNQEQGWTWWEAMFPDPVNKRTDVNCNLSLSLWFQILCTLIAAFLHFFFLSSFCWVLTEAWQSYMAVTGRLRNRIIRKRFLCLGWGGISDLCLLPALLSLPES